MDQSVGSMEPTEMIGDQSLVQKPFNANCRATPAEMLNAPIAGALTAERSRLNENIYEDRGAQFFGDEALLPTWLIGSGGGIPGLIIHRQASYRKNRWHVSVSLVQCKRRSRRFGRMPSERKRMGGMNESKGKNAAGESYRLEDMSQKGFSS